jgi:excisionase family DNA binding protein
MQLLQQEKPKALSVRDAANYTGLSESYLRILIERRDLPVVRVGRTVRLLRDDLESFLLTRRRAARFERSGDAE